MSHLKFSFSGNNTFWRYLVMVVAVFLAINTIGGIPLIIGFATRTISDPDALSRLHANPADLSAIGITANLGLFMMLFPFLVGLITFAILVKPLHGRTLKQTIGGSSSVRWKRALVSAFVWTIFSAIYLFSYKLLEPANFRINNTSSTLIWLVAISLIFIPFQASFEEVIFRGYLMQGFTVLTSRDKGYLRYISFVTGSTLFPLIMTSLLFGMMHSWNPEIKQYGFFTMIPQYIIFGLLFGTITVLDDGIEIAAGAHASNNIFVSIMLTNSSSTLLTPALFKQTIIQPWVDFWALLVISVIFFIIMKKIYGWKDLSVLWKKVEAPPDSESSQ